MVAQPRATTREALLSAATSVFLEKGYRNATLDDIAAQAGISKPTVYRYARGKQWMMDQIVAKVFADASAAAEEVWADDLPVDERLRRLVLVNVEVALESGPFFRVAYAEYRESTPEVRTEFATWAKKTTEDTRQLLEIAAEEGVLDLPGDSNVYANLLQGLFASLYRWTRKDGRSSAEDLADHILNLLSSARREPLVQSV